MGSKNLSDEIAGFKDLWKGGYYEGDPLLPLTRSSYRNLGYISILYATYLRCVRPYINDRTVALEIGPGRGTWTKGLLDAKEIWVLDALSAEHNRFFEYLDHPENVNYIQVNDFECKELPDDHFNYMFSFGCLCHISFDGIRSYAENLFPKLRSGSNCFWMVADKRRYEQFVRDSEHFNIWKQMKPMTGKFAYFGRLFDVFSRLTTPELLNIDTVFTGQDGTWHDAGEERTCEMLEKVGYKIIEADVGTVPRDPIIHFMKP